MVKSLSRRLFIQSSAAAAAVGALAPTSLRAQNRSVVVAYNVKLPSWDPTVGLSAVNPTIQSLYRAVFDPFIDQNPDLSFRPGILTDWAWNDNKTQIRLTVRNNAFWHNGDPVTAQDVAWSLQRAGDPKSGNPIQFIWSTIGNYRVSGNVVTADVLRFEPTLFKWMAFLTAYVMPQKYYERVGAEEFERRPIGSGPYMAERYERDAFVRLRAFPQYHGPKPAFQTAVYKFVPDAASRIAEIRSGSSDVTLEIPYEEYLQLIQKPQFNGSATPVSDIAMIFLNDNHAPMQDKNVRLAANLAINKDALVNQLLRGFGVPLHTLQAPQYSAFDPSTRVPYDPQRAKLLLAKSGYSPDNPVRFNIQTTRGFKPKDYEVIQAVVSMWRDVGIRADVQIYEIAQHFELRARDELEAAAFYNWGNSIGDPSTSTGFAMFGPSPHSTWDTDDLDAMIAPLWGEPDEAVRIQKYKNVDKYIAEQGYVIPLFQYVQPIVHRSDVAVTPHVAGFLPPQALKPS